MKNFKKKALTAVFGFITAGFLSFPVHAAYEITYNAYGAWTLDKETETSLQGSYPQNVGNLWYKKDGTLYEKNYWKNTEIPFDIREAGAGQHLYYKRVDNIRIAEWYVSWEQHYCIHSDTAGNHIDVSSWGLENRFGMCKNKISPGWIAKCADCGETISLLVYADEDTISKVSNVRGDGFYYSYCPVCDTLEQAWHFQHDCKFVSPNRYYIHYDGKGATSGLMADSVHYAENATVYEGETVESISTLSVNTYKKEGHYFAGWNTDRDGNGERYSDGDEVWKGYIKKKVLSDKGRESCINDPIVLYAQWEVCNSKLVVDANGGTYLGQPRYGLVQGYDTVYTLNPSALNPPAGHTLFLNAGSYGTSAGSVTGTKSFSGWAFDSSFAGTLDGNTYVFKRMTLPEEVEVLFDTVTAQYTDDAIILPDVTVNTSDRQFTGWYYDSSCTDFAGSPGDSITISRDTTVYAGYSTLSLNAVSDYTVNGGKGAVNLDWYQNGAERKTYELFQTTDAGTALRTADECLYSEWRRLNAVTGESSGISYSPVTVTAVGETRNITVGASGTYRIDAYGAAGSSYGGYTGGSGGHVSGTVYLEAGDVITVTNGGKGTGAGSGGYNGGGSGSTYGNGGGMTTVASRNKGTLFIAGGGGAATGQGNGGNGGMSQSLIAGNTGGSGQAGGGGGYSGGSAGEIIYHVHDAAVCGYHVHTGDTVNGGECYRTTITHTHAEQPAEAPTWEGQTAPCYSSKYNKIACCESNCRGSGGVVNGFTHIAGSCTNSRCTGLPNQAAVRCDFCHGPVSYSNAAVNFYSWELNCSKTTEYAMSCTFSEGWQCCYEEGDIEASNPAYGGSSYVNTAVVSNSGSEAGVNNADGYTVITPVHVGYIDTNSLSGVSAPDLAKPDTVSEIRMTAEGEYGRKFAWNQPADNGTAYYHCVISYIVSASGASRTGLTSNVTENVLTTGVKKYYYAINQNAGYSVGPGDMTVTGRTDITADISTFTAGTYYFHVAAADGAGNVADTAHYRFTVASEDTPGDEPLTFPVVTGQISVSSTGTGFYQKSLTEYFVRADGRNTVTLENSAWITGNPNLDYQINSVWYSVQGTAGTQQISTGIPFGQSFSEETYSASVLETVYGAPGYLTSGSLTKVCRADQSKRVTISQRFIPSAAYDGQEIYVFPSARALNRLRNETENSDTAADYGNGVKLTFDGTPPVITGTEYIEALENAASPREPHDIVITASDAVSGLSELTVTLLNEDNYLQGTWESTTGYITVSVTDAQLFNGKLSFTVTATDNVGNTATYGNTVESLDLRTDLKKELPDHDRNFKAGQAGFIYLTSMGYIDKIEIVFPEELESIYSRNYTGTMGTVITYDFKNGTAYDKFPGVIASGIIEDKYEFWVPVYTEPGTYRAKIIPYKNGVRLDRLIKYEEFYVDGTILDDFKTVILK